MCLKSWPQFWKIVEEVRSRRRKWVTGMLSLEHHSLRLCVTVASCCGLSNCLFFLSQCLPCHHRLYILNPEPTEAFPLVVSAGYLIIKTKVSNLGTLRFCAECDPHSPQSHHSTLHLTFLWQMPFFSSGQVLLQKGFCICFSLCLRHTSLTFSSG